MDKNHQINPFQGYQLLKELNTLQTSLPIKS